MKQYLKMGTAVAVTVAVALTVSAPAYAGTDPADRGPAGSRLADDVSLPPELQSRQRARAGEGPGYNTLADIVEVLGDYTITLISSPGVEQLRPHLGATASELEWTRGGNFTVASERQPDRTFANPSRGEINLKVSSTSACPGDWIGCAGPRRAEYVDGGLRTTAGVVWINPAVLSFPTAAITNTLLHEVAHTLGLAHYQDQFEGQRQVMHPVVSNLTAYRGGDINGLTALSPVDAPPVAEVEPFASPSALIDRQARDFLGRPANSWELGFYGESLVNGPSTADSVIRSFALRPASYDPLGSVTRLYIAYFLRSPDDGGLDYWLGRYEQGRSLNSISEFFARSAEFEARYGSLSNRSFVRRVYRNVLGREGDAAGVNFWTGELNSSRRQRGRVMTGFSESAEFRAQSRERVEVVAVHLGMLGQAPSPDVSAADVAALEGGVPLTDIIGRIRSSSAYANRVI